MNAVGRIAQLRDGMQEKIINSASSQKFLEDTGETTKIDVPEEEALRCSRQPRLLSSSAAEWITRGLDVEVEE